MTDHRIAGRMASVFAVLACFVALLPSPSSAEPSAIDLKLFEKSEVDRSKGCSVVLWQDDRDPEKDKYAYIFAETLSGKNHARQPARIKIGGVVTTMKRVATGGKTTGYELYEYQVYQLPEEKEFVILQLRLAEEEGESVDVESGVMIIIMKGKPVFRATVKGNAGCNTPAAIAVSEPPAKPTPPRALEPPRSSASTQTNNAASAGSGTASSSLAASGAAAAASGAGGSGGAPVAAPITARYGAIAYSRSTRAHGWAINHLSRQASENQALAGCGRHARDCFVPVWFKNGCGALAVGSNGYGTGWGAGRYIAERIALRGCSRHTSSCSVRRWACTSR